MNANIYLDKVQMSKKLPININITQFRDCLIHLYISPYHLFIHVWGGGGGIFYSENRKNPVHPLVWPSSTAHILLPFGAIGEVHTE